MNLMIAHAGLLDAAVLLQALVWIILMVRTAATPAVPPPVSFRAIDGDCCT